MNSLPMQTMFTNCPNLKVAARIGSKTSRPWLQRNLTCCANVRARWCLDVRYGRKGEAIALLQDWVKEVGANAGLHASNTRISSGAIGVPESRLEMEVSFPNFAEWERFLANIPPKEHKAWSQRIQAMIVDGSPRWEVYRSCEVGLNAVSGQSTTSAVEPSPQPAQPTPPAQVADDAEQDKKLQIVDNEDRAQYVMDWKGERMRISPGDKLPFKFL